ncbi:MAG: ABC transporter ATP-binding protein [Candidatus Caldatribacteriaceae bacterium]
MLQVENLQVMIGDRLVLNGLNLTIREGEVHVLLGPNGVGKTTLLMAIMGVPGYKIVYGRLVLNGEDITHLEMEERVKKGIGIAFQKMPPVRGISLRTMGEIIIKTQGESDFSLVEEIARRLDCEYLLSREVGVGFSGGEAKRAEIFQLLLQRPLFSMIDEPESGVDLDNIALVGKALRELFERGQIRTKKRSGLVITHTGYILDYLNADWGHVLMNGRIICSGNPRDLFEDIRTKGYNECLRCEQ